MNREKYPWVYDVLFLLVFALAGYLRLTGVNWGEGQHQHPDENTFASVLYFIQAQKCADSTVPVIACPPEQKRWLSLADYFNSKTSTLNPYNIGFPSFVYGDLPMVAIRIAADLTHQVNPRFFGRQASALADLFAIFFLYLIVSNLYNRRVALLASVFSALAVMQIQQSHFFTIDLFVNMFELLAVYFAVKILKARYSGLESKQVDSETSDLEAENSELMESPEGAPLITDPPLSLRTKYASEMRYVVRVLRHPLFLLSLAFGVAYGMAMSSKLNIYPLAILLPGAFAVRYFLVDRAQQSEKPYPSEAYWSLIIICLMAGGLAAIISFRVFQPYAFDGLKPDPRWVADITQQRAQATGKADMPWNLQWARRTHLYSFTNLTVWGLGLPLGILAWIGFLWMGWRVFKGEWRHALLWGWTAIYFFWQSMQFNPTMRYQLPVYPFLQMMAAWFIFELAASNVERFKGFKLPQLLAGILGIAVVALTAIWAFAFHSIYLRPEPRIAASYWILQNVPGPINLQIDTEENGIYNQPVPFPAGGYVRQGLPYETTIFLKRNGTIESISLGHALNTLASSSTLKLSLSIAPHPTPKQILATATLNADFDSDQDPRGKPYTLKLDRPVPAVAGQPYYLRLEVDAGRLTIEGDTVANETDYDYPLPFTVDGYDPFGGIYRGDLNLQVYWGDTEEQLGRYVEVLSQTDYILIPTNHQYAQITRVPERYPLTTFYYRELIGCPSGKNITECYRTAKPGVYKGRLGFDLVAVFENYPTLGSLVINDQTAEEAFTFYDHPKVLVFKKNKDFNVSELRATLSTVDLTKVVHLLPTEFSKYSNLMLPDETLAKQRAGGTWSQLFNYSWIQNRFPVLGLVVWYLFIFILGLAVYPLLRLALPGLADKGYPLSRAFGLVLFGYLAWIAGSAGIPYTRTTIAIVLGFILLVGAGLAYYQRPELREEWKIKNKYFLIVEGIFLTFFLFDLVIRLGNPDLWHPAKGGERPMDFSYFNAILKSTSFPPYDPWFAGGYINYYYYGFVLVGTPVKLLGIVPSIAYNFILPTLFAMVGICAFSIGWNLVVRDKGEQTKSPPILDPSYLTGGLAASILTIFLGNLGTIQLLFQRFEQIGAGHAFTWESTISIFQRWAWAIQGFAQVAKGIPLGLGLGDWYWYPSRVVPPLGGNEITEFPLFTFIYSDLHAHMIAMPLALLAISWALAIVAGRARWKNSLSAALGFAVGGLIIGSLYPSNLSDMYTYLPIGLAALGYGIGRYAESRSLTRRFGLAMLAVLALTVLSFILYEPYRNSYSQVYSALDPWSGPHTPLGSYLTHWLVLLFIVVCWMVWETREWMAQTPVSALARLRPYQLIIEGFLVALVFLLLALQYFGTSVGWIALPIATWAGILLLQPTMSDAKRFVLFLVGTALVITLVVEVVVVRGDIGRQNTIFKFYLQSWFLLAVSGGAAFAWTLPAFFRWLPGWRAFWQTAMILLISGAALFTVSGAMGKMRDRWIVEAPHTLDSMTFMKYAHYDDFGERMDLREDYAAIRWMQDHVPGSPVLVEASCVEYHWCKRFITYTGLPGVVGWNWHQRQQRGLMATWVQDRVDQTDNFYNSININSARNFLKTFDVKYIIVGQLERAEYTPDGIAKFKRYEGKYWREIYRDGDTAIYEVLP
jgi:YYY domain-containing protein